MSQTILRRFAAGVGTVVMALPLMISLGMLGSTGVASATTPALPNAPTSPNEVVSSSGVDTGANCGTGLSSYAGTVYSTIQSAVNAANPGDTIYVCAGTYNEAVTMSKPLTLDGAQWSVAANSSVARTTVADESIISAPSAANADVSYSVDSATMWATTPALDGFTLQNAGDGTESSTVNTLGIEAAQSNADTNGVPNPTDEGSGYNWSNNIIENTGGAIVFQASGQAGGTMISGNRFTTNNAALVNNNSFAGSAVYVNDGPADNTTISNNLFQSQDGNAINTSGNPGAGKSTGLTISNNTSVDDVNFLFLIEATNPTVTGNTISWDASPLGGTCDFAGFGGILVAGGSSGVTVSSNTVNVAAGVQQAYPTLTVDQQACNAVPGDYFGIEVANVWDPASTTVTVNNNKVTGAYNGIWVSATGGPMEPYCNGNPGSSGGNGPCGYGDNVGFAITNNTVTSSVAHGLWIDNGTAVIGTNRGFTVSGNIVSSSGATDCQDDTSGTATAGTANTWTNDVGLQSTPSLICPRRGYWLAASDGGIFSFGDAQFYGSTGALTLNKPIVGMASTPDHKGYWLVASDGGIFSFGDAQFYGSTGSLVLNKPIVGMASTPSGKGYWLVASDGGIFSFGDATFHGSTGSLVLNKPIVGMASTPSGKGYWLVASDGGIFSFGDATFHGSTGSLVLNKPIVGMAATADGGGYWLVASDGGIFSEGDAIFYGSTGNIVLNKPIVGMSITPDGKGYWLVASDGGIFSEGDAVFYGSTGNIVLNKPIVGMAAT